MQVVCLKCGWVASHAADACGRCGKRIAPISASVGTEPVPAARDGAPPSTVGRGSPWPWGHLVVLGVVLFGLGSGSGWFLASTLDGDGGETFRAFEVDLPPDGAWMLPGSARNARVAVHNAGVAEAVVTILARVSSDGGAWVVSDGGRVDRTLDADSAGFAYVTFHAPAREGPFRVEIVVAGSVAAARELIGDLRAR